MTIYSRKGKGMTEEDVWQAAERYRDLITNALDLFSFLIVTPELIRVVPAVRTIPFIIFLTPVLLVFLLIGIRVLHDAYHDLISAGDIAIFIFFLCLIVLFCVPVLWDSAVSTSSWVRKHAFLLGVTIFLISRTFAFVIAAHQVLKF
jgi:hypothetical protein